MQTIVRPTYRSWRAWQRNRDVYLKQWKTNGLAFFFEPVLLYIIMGLGMGKVIQDIEGMSYREFIGPGLVAGYVMQIAVMENGWGTYFRMAVRRTFDAMIVTPVSIEDVITGEILWGATRGALTGFVVLLIIAIAGDVNSPMALLVIPAAFLTGLVFAGASVIYTSQAPSSDFIGPFFSIIIYPMFFIAGVFFPIGELPRALEVFAWCLPLTWSVDIMRHLMEGEVNATMLWGTIGLIALSAFFYGVSLVLMRRRLIR
jgi:lipooligosaccharide transport system permease protein